MSDEMENQSVEEVVDTADMQTEEAVETVETPVAEADATEEATIAVEENAVASVEEEAEVTATENVGDTATEDRSSASENVVADVVQKVKSNKKLLAIAAAVLAVVLVIANAPKIGNAAVKLFTSPAGYFQHVEGKAAEEMVEKFADSYDTVISSVFATDDMGSSAEIGIELGEEVRELMEDATEVDFDWLEKVSFSVKADSKKDTSKTTLGLSLNGEQLISTILIANMADGMGYSQFPELNKYYLGVELDEFFEMNDVDADLDDIKEMQDTMKEIYGALPKKAKVEKVMKRYSSLAISCIEDVKQEKEEVTVGDYTEKYTVLEATIDEETLQDMLAVIIEELKKDKDVKEIIAEVAASQDEVDADEVYEAFLEALDDAEDEIDDLDDAKFELIWKTYVDGKGDIYGRVLEIEEEEVEVSSLMVMKGSKYAYELEAEVEGQKFSLDGAGKMTGSKLNGEFKLKVLSMKVADITVEDVKLKDLEDGYFNGTVSVSLSGVIAEAMESELDEFPFDMKDLVLKIDSDCGKSKANVKVSLYEDEKLLGAVYAESKTGKADSIKIPKESEVIMIEEEEDALDWVSEIDLDAFLDSLEGKVDDEILDFINDLISGEASLPSFDSDEDDYYYDEDYWYDEEDYWYDDSDVWGYSDEWGW